MEASDSSEKSFPDCFSSWDPPGECTTMLLHLIRIVVSVLVSVVLNIGIIMYENLVPDTYRTLVNKLVAVMALYNILFLAGIVPVTMPYVLNIHLPETFCGIQTFFVNGLSIAEILVHNEVCFLLWFCTMRGSFVHRLNEDFGRKFLLMLNFSLSLFASSLMHLYYGTSSFLWFSMCNGDVSAGKFKAQDELCYVPYIYVHYLSSERGS